MTRNIEAIRILVVEDEPFIAWDIADFLREAGYEIQDICYDAASATESIERNKPDLCLLDINLGKGPDGISLGQTINSKWQIPFIYLTSYTDDATLERAKKNMPYGYISKPIQFESLKSTIEITLHNFKNRNAPQTFSIENINKALDAELTPREFELLKDMYEGKTNQQLTLIHFISSNTVKSHVHRIYEKFDCHTRSAVIAKIRKILTD
ncbi:response regulator [Haliscomenobacter sp.]|uniref:response regulator n=1 Tax=Haliscomenobacter sp. TaxID=2717303 RepID=UPI003593D965